MFPREHFFWARVSVCKTVGIPSVGGFFLFATELATKRGVTNDYYTDRRVPLVKPSVIILPTECISFTDGISPSVKLFDGVVVLEYILSVLDFFYFL